MLAYFLLLFVSVPLVEFWLMYRISGIIGLQWTILIIITTGIIGGTMARQQGLTLLMRIRAELQAGSVPKDKIIEGLFLLIGGLVLLLPGYLTDFIGFMLLVPGNRRLLREMVKKYFKKRILLL